MKLNYLCHKEVPIPADELKRLYDHIGWWPERSLDDIEQILQQSVAIGAWQGDQCNPMWTALIPLN